MHSQFAKGISCFAYRQVLDETFASKLIMVIKNSSVRGLKIKAFSNDCIIVHITFLLTALEAIKTGNKDKIRLVKSFLPNI
jgi:hypothetical protein